MQNANECVNLIMKHLKCQGLAVQKSYMKKRKILESEVNDKAVKELKIHTLLDRINQFEDALKREPSYKNAQTVIMLYNKAIEYYSALNDEKHLQYLQKLRDMFSDERFQKLLEPQEDTKESEEISENGMTS